MHAEMWRERLADTPQFRAAVDELWPYALGVLPAGSERRSRSASAARRSPPSEGNAARTPTSSPELWNEMTMVRRSAPAGAQW